MERAIVRDHGKVDSEDDIAAYTRDVKTYLLHLCISQFAFALLAGNVEGHKKQNGYFKE